MRKFSVLLFIIFNSIFAIQAKDALYTVSVSDKYYAKIFREDNDAESCAGWIGIYEKADDKELINQRCESIWQLSDPDDEDITDIPMDMQDLILFGDVNFDGIPDFLLRDDKAGARAPSYKIYLANQDGSLVYNKEFSDLTDYYYGFFTIDSENNQIVVLDKANDEALDSVLFFDVVDNTPRLRKTLVDEYDKNLPFINQRTISTWNDQSEIVSSETFPIFSSINKGIDIVYSFYVEEDDDVVILLLKTDDDKLYYVVNTEDEDQVEGNKLQFYNELRFEDTTNSPRNARYSTNKEEELISFDAQDGATYELYNTPQSAGVRITKEGKKTEIKGNIEYRENNSFSDILKDLNVKI